MKCAIRSSDDRGNLGVHVCSAGSSSEAAVRSEVGAARGELDAVFDAPIADRTIALTLASDGELSEQKKRRQEPLHA